MHFTGNFSVLVHVVVHVIHLMWEAGARGALIQIVCFLLTLLFSNKSCFSEWRMAFRMPSRGQQISRSANVCNTPSAGPPHALTPTLTPNISLPGNSASPSINNGHAIRFVILLCFTRHVNWFQWWTGCIKHQNFAQPTEGPAAKYGTFRKSSQQFKCWKNKAAKKASPSRFKCEF